MDQNNECRPTVTKFNKNAYHLTSHVGPAAMRPGETALFIDGKR